MTDDPAVDARRSHDAFYRRSLEDPDAFWSEAAQLIDWSTAPDRMFEQPDPPSFRWFPGGHTNLAYKQGSRPSPSACRRPGIGLQVWARNEPSTANPDLDRPWPLEWWELSVPS